MKLFLSISRKQVGELYHYTTKDALLDMLRNDRLKLATGRGTLVEQKLQRGANYFASLTRSRFGGYHFKGDTDSAEVYGQGRVMITFDGDALSDHYKIVPVDYWGYRGSTDKSLDHGKEVEERLISDEPQIPILKFIKRIDFIQAANFMVKETFGLDSGKFKLREHDIELQERKLGSIILRLKKNHIKYGFFQNTSDWARKKNEFHFIGRKGVETTGPVRYSTYVRGYKDLVALLDALNKPWSEMSEAARKVCQNALSYPTDADSILNDYENSRKPNADANLRQVTLKITRIMKRLELNTSKDVAKYVAQKARVIREQEEKQRQQKSDSTILAAIIVGLCYPVDEWTDEVRQRLNFLSDSGWYGTYMADQLLDVIQRQRLNATEQAKQLRELADRSETGFDILHRIHNKFS